MSTALVARTAIALAYLTALLLTGRAEPLTGMVAAAVLAIWAVPLLRDRIVARSYPSAREPLRAVAHRPGS
jgi:hypothetical protein